MGHTIDRRISQKLAYQEALKSCVYDFEPGQPQNSKEVLSSVIAVIHTLILDW